ncbi:GntR family transcriptional regulator [Halomonas urumqiensis]|uniref:GntR family transcriptional regulator n=1 Tax=Halomonas urumqiensis TaxID=1684789 RepID=A0A2N7UDU9_9GAMM|nr:GntR family transcriptional regulator [Halomonas urumqiensis]PMR78565.1 GntR family transcriptional regulator [Halomonas urumqiensis]PTB03709.1 GntR family transcriptional regulator [Halomonas urumqiensis]GHE20074.1 transcriptional regulator [Halomonas urumqiensis]
MDSRYAQLRLDAKGGNPLYQQLARQLEQAIEDGAWQAGEALPSERNLAEALDISRITARKALDRLEELGLIRRIRGSGTFITPRFHQPLTRLSSFTEMLTQRGFTTSSHWLQRSLANPSIDEAMRLSLPPGARVARLKRLRLADDVVMAVEESCLLAELLPEPRAVESSLYAVLDAAGTPVARALQQITAINADAELAGLAQVPEGQALLKVTRVGYLADGTPAELTVTWCRTNYYDFTVELTR